MVRNQNIADLPRYTFPAFGIRSLLERTVILSLKLSPWSSISVSVLDLLMFRSTSLVHIFDCVVLVRSESTVTYRKCLESCFLKNYEKIEGLKGLMLFLALM